MMMVTKQIPMDILHRSTTPRVDVVQGDRNSRAVEFYLTADGIPWPVPVNAQISISYLRPDGTGGQYQTLEDGSRPWFVAGNSLTVVLIPEMLEVEGAVMLSVRLQVGTASLSTFTAVVDVQGDVAQMIPQKG